MRPARRPSKAPANPAVAHARWPAATFVTQVLAQYEQADPDSRDAAKAYAAVDALAYDLPKVAVASL